MKNQIKPSVRDVMTKTISQIETSGEPRFFRDVATILIPKKAEYNLRKYVSKALLKEIDNDVNVAVEKCLIFLSLLDYTIYKDVEIEKWKSLSSVLLHAQFNRKENESDYVYVKIIKLLKIGTKKTGPFIMVEDSYQVGEKNKTFRLTDIYSKGLITYKIQTKELVERRTRHYYKQLSELYTNPITKNLLNFYSMVSLPTEKELLTKGKELVKTKTTNKKGKLYTYQGKHAKSRWKNLNERRFVGDDINLFNYFTALGYMIPSIGDYKSGGRVVDSFNMMPSWCRKMIQLYNSPAIEIDFSTLHPNLVNSLYKGSKTSITHDIVAEYLGVDRRVAKVEHLSFFNKSISGMKKSPLWKYYIDNEPDMMNKIIADKEIHYKRTCTKIFKMEVDIMSEAISRLNEEGIFVGYIYDALITTEENREKVIEIMNETAKDFNVNTEVSVEEDFSNDVTPIETIEVAVTEEKVVPEVIEEEVLEIKESIKPFSMEEFISNTTETDVVVTDELREMLDVLGGDKLLENITDGKITLTVDMVIEYIDGQSNMYFKIWTSDEENYYDAQLDFKVPESLFNLNAIKNEKIVNLMYNYQPTNKRK